MADSLDGWVWIVFKKCNPGDYHVKTNIVLTLLHAAIVEALAILFHTCLDQRWKELFWQMCACHSHNKCSDISLWIFYSFKKKDKPILSG